MRSAPRSSTPPPGRPHPPDSRARRPRELAKEGRLLRPVHGYSASRPFAPTSRDDSTDGPRAYREPGGWAALHRKGPNDPRQRLLQLATVSTSSRVLSVWGDIACGLGVGRNLQTLALTLGYATPRRCGRAAEIQPRRAEKTLALQDERTRRDETTMREIAAPDAGLELVGQHLDDHLDRPPFR